AAIAAVSKIRILSKTPDSRFGAMLEAEGGEIVNFIESGCTDGTTIIVEDLFYNVPARRKFLKKDSTEATACSTVVEKIALSHPEIAVKFISDGEVRFMTSGSGKLIETIYAIYGRDISRRSLPVDREEDGIRVTGFISEPDMSKNNRNMENFFINGRYVKSRTASAAVEQAYSSKSQADKFPFCVINIEINPTVVDVNVHPAKLEVKFTNEKLIFDAVYYAVLNALEADALRPELKLGDTLGGSASSVPKKADSPYRVDNYKGQTGFGSKDFGKKPSANQSYGNAFLPKDAPIPKTEQLRISAEAYKNTPPETPKNCDSTAESNTQTNTELIESYRRAKESLASLKDFTPSPITADTPSPTDTLPSPTPAAPEKEESRPTIPESRAHTEGAVEDTPTTADKFSPPEYTILGEAYNCYIIVQLEDRILMVDKHAAHERIIFDELCRKMHQAKRQGQILLVPYEINILCSEAEAIEEYSAKIRDMGFDFTSKNTGVSSVTYSLTQIPEELNINEAAALFADLAEKLSSVTATVESASAEFFESRLWQAACKAAIKGGRKYDGVHLKWICDRLLVKPEEGKSVIRTCPHGRPVAFEIKKSSIERQFARLQ
ncbi:MAG: hypothetical protein E7638_06485, partial [Ruminococcaceae bacterium]|nr:hypothetical protein [Oscillospiraceae bacterium]